MIERNLEQMIKILHMRLDTIGEAAKLRREYCIQDLKPNSRLTSSQLPGIAADYDDLGPKNSMKEMSKSTYVGHNKVALNIL